MLTTLCSYSKNVISSIRSMMLNGKGRGDGDKMVKDCRSTSTAVLSHTHYTVVNIICYNCTTTFGSCIKWNKTGALMYAICKNESIGFSSVFSFFYYAFPTIEKRCQRHTVFGSVHLWVCEPEHPKNLLNTTSQKPMKGISPNLGHRCIWIHRCADWILESIKGQRSRSQQAKS